MIPEERVQLALELMRLARHDVEQADLEPDPVTQRRYHVTAAGRLRRAADFLDDQGRLTE